MKPNSPDAIEYSKVLSDRLNTYVPLLKCFMGITLFGYARTFLDNQTAFYAMSDWTLNQHFHSVCQDIALSDYYHNMAPSEEVKKYFMVWPDNVSHCSSEIALNMGYWHGAQLIIERNSYIELFWVATDLANNRIKDSYIAKSAVLTKFFQHFSNENAEMLEKITPDNCHVFEKGFNISALDVIKAGYEEDQQKTEQFLKAIHRGPFPQLSNQEQRCIKFLAQGRTMKEIGCLLNISPRTVESYIENIKDKTGYHCKSQIIDLFWRDKREVSL